jgi:peroxiredoxin
VEFPHIERIYREYRDEPFAVVAVESKGDRTGARALIEEEGYTFPVLFDTRGVHRDDYGVYAFPTSLLIDPDGNIVYRHVGFYPGMEVILENEIRELLGMPPRTEPAA